MTADLPLALAGTVALGMACQWAASKLRLPAILLLLAAGLVFGPGLDAVGDFGPLHGRLLDPDTLLGNLLLPVVSLSVALILFEGGLTLDLDELKQGGVVTRLCTIGAVVTWCLATFAASTVLGFPAGLATLLGAILVVTGPTVIGPLIRFVKPTGPVGPILRWEGIIIDPIGALMALLVFDIVVSGHFSAAAIVGSAVRVLGTGSLFGFAGAGLMVLMLRRGGAADHLHNPLVVALVLLVFAGSNAVQHESGLAAVTVMGMTMAWQRRVPVEHVLEFKESLSVLLISSLFILLASRLTLQQLRTLDWRVAGFVAVLIVVVRPVSVAMATAGSKLTGAERAFLALMAPRGIVAAAVASVFAIQLVERRYDQAERFVPVTFAVVAGTVLFYGLATPAIARMLGLSKPGRGGMLIVGADRVGRAIATALRRERVEVLLVDSDPADVSASRLEDLPVTHANALGREFAIEIGLTGIGRMMAVTPNGEVNALAALRFARQFGRDHVYQIGGRPPKHTGKRLRAELFGRELFGAGVTHKFLTDRLEDGWIVKATRLSPGFDYTAYRRHYGQRALLLMIINERRELHVVTSEDVLAPKPGETVIGLVHQRDGTRPQLLSRQP